MQPSVTLLPINLIFEVKLPFESLLTWSWNISFPFGFISFNKTNTLEAGLSSYFTQPFMGIVSFRLYFASLSRDKIGSEICVA